MKTTGRLAFAILLAVATMLPVPGRELRAQASLAPVVDTERAQRYQERLVSSVHGLRLRPSFAELVPLLLRGTGENANVNRAADENRAALLVLAFYVNNWSLGALVPEARTWPRAERRTVLLRGRRDLARHFAVSAVLSAYTGTAVANAVGLSKEMDDVRGASGFSFSDIAADRAGTLFGQMATASPESAARLVRRLADGVTEDDIMPAIVGLPDNLSRAEFTRRYGGVGDPAYIRLVDEIDRRVAALPLFQ